LEQTISYAKAKGLYVIADVKRNDIGSTAEAYANAYLGETKIEDEIFQRAFDADSATINAYLGIDGIEPFIKEGKGIFVLVKTSNPSSGQVQDIIADGEPIYEKMAKLVDDWGKGNVGKYGYSNVGAVVGATYPVQLKKLRKIMPKAYFLVPGYGAQGGKAEDVAKAFNQDGLGAIINASRSIMCAYKNTGANEEDFAKAARQEAINMRDEIRRHIQ
jgi:orotidine-5'-phosphate decarboxylase